MRYPLIAIEKALVETRAAFERVYDSGLTVSWLTAEETIGEMLARTGKTFADFSVEELSEMLSMPLDFHCVDCGFDTGPGMDGREQVEAIRGGGGGNMVLRPFKTEIYTVRREVWEASGVLPHGGCLCVECLERRIGRRLEPEDFDPESFAEIPPQYCTPRLAERRFRLTRAARRALRAKARRR